MQIAKYLAHFQSSTRMNKNVNIFLEPNSTDPGKNYDIIHIRQPNYESILTSIHSKLWKLRQRQNRYNFSFNHPFKIKHVKRINILVVLQYKSKKELSKISSIVWWYNYIITFNYNNFTLWIINIHSYILLALYFFFFHSF